MTEGATQGELPARAQGSVPDTAVSAVLGMQDTAESALTSVYPGHGTVYQREGVT